MEKPGISNLYFGAPGVQQERESTAQELLKKNQLVLIFAPTEKTIRI